MSTLALAMPADKANSPVASPFTKSLQELMEDGIYLLFLLRNGNPPNSLAEFQHRVDQFLARFEADARRLEKHQTSVSDAKYAFCALIDEIILSSDFSIRSDWERAPLQLRLFGEHLAGERFFDKLDTLRQDPVANIESLEVFYTALLLGFQGKYLLEGTEKLNYLISRLGQEITHARGGRREFSPNWALPQRFQHYVRNELPLWLFYALLAVAASILFFLFQWFLESGSEELAELQARPVTSISQPGGSTEVPAPVTAPTDKPRTSS